MTPATAIQINEASPSTLYAAPPTRPSLRLITPRTDFAPVSLQDAIDLAQEAVAAYDSSTPSATVSGLLTSVAYQRTHGRQPNSLYFMFDDPGRGKMHGDTWVPDTGRGAGTFEMVYGRWDPTNSANHLSEISLSTLEALSADPQHDGLHVVGKHGIVIPGGHAWPVRSWRTYDHEPFTQAQDAGVLNLSGTGHRSIYAAVADRGAVVVGSGTTKNPVLVLPEDNSARIVPFLTE